MTTLARIAALQCCVKDCSQFCLLEVHKTKHDLDQVTASYDRQHVGHDPKQVCVSEQTEE